MKIKYYRCPFSVGQKFAVYKEVQTFQRPLKEYSISDYYIDRVEPFTKVIIP